MPMVEMSGGKDKLPTSDNRPRNLGWIVIVAHLGKILRKLDGWRSLKILCKMEQFLEFP